MNEANNPYSSILDLAPRLLSLLDRSPSSLTFGCFDRCYWQYKTERDFASAPFQQGVLALALLYKTPDAQNKYYKNSSLVSWIHAALSFWQKLQNRDGSFNEWYPYEHSHVATAFTTYAVTETLLLLRDEIAPSSELLKAVHKAATWLSRNTDKKVLNHTAGAVAALHNAFLLTGNLLFQMATQKNLKIMAHHQSKEGWFYEYGGADPGYQSVSIDFLAKYYIRSKDENAKTLLRNALQFLVYFIHPDGTSGGEYGSRGTKYLMPHGLELLSGEFPEALHILKNTFWKGYPLANVNPASADDRYFTFFFLPNTLQAWALKTQKSVSEIAAAQLPEDRSRFFPDSGLLVQETSKYYFVANLKKGGAFKFYSKNGGDLTQPASANYFAICKNDKVASPHWLNKKTKIKTNVSSYSCETELRYLDQTLPLRKFLIPFRLFNYTFCRWPALARLLKKCIILKMIKRKNAPLSFQRTFTLSPSSISVEDTFRLKPGSLSVKSIHIEPSTVGLHVPSSNFFRDEDLLNPASIDTSLLSQLSQTGVLKLKTFFGDNG